MMKNETPSKKTRIIPWIFRGILLVLVVWLVIASVRGFPMGKLVTGPKEARLEAVEGSDYTKIWESKPKVDDDGVFRYKTIMFSGWKDLGWIEFKTPTMRIRSKGRSGRAALIVKTRTGQVVYNKRIRRELQTIEVDRPAPYRVYLVGAWYNATTEIIPVDVDIR